MRSKLIALIVLSGTVVGAQAAGNPTAGQEKSAVCAGCHGVDGNSVAPVFPNLAGQHASYLEKQLTELKSGNRQDPTMSTFAAMLSAQDMADLAAYFTAQKTTPGASEVDADVLARGKKVYLGGDAYNNVPACASCHTPTGSGNPAARFPLLKSQHAAYTAKQLHDFKSGSRSNDPNKIMRDVVANLSDGDIDAVAEYIATLPVD